MSTRRSSSTTTSPVARRERGARSKVVLVGRHMTDSNGAPSFANFSLGIYSAGKDARLTHHHEVPSWSWLST